MKTKILLWPGIGKDLSVLDTFVEELKINNKEIIYFKEDYDYEGLNPNNWCQVFSNDCDWWIGISLGASLLYYVYSYVPKEKRPSRITLINPFYSRRVLSKEKNFDIDKYWDFEPINMKEFIEHCELIVSNYDKNINPYHSLTLSFSINSVNKYIILINSDHTLKMNNVQKELADLLISYDERGYKIEKENNNCNIYKQQ